MRTYLRLLLLLLAWMVIAPTKTWAQSEGTAFSCDGTFYQIRQIGATSSLFRVNRSAATYTTSPINIMNNGTSNNLGVLLNGLSYNPQDGYLYALSTTGTSNTVPAANTIRLYKIGQGGIRDLGTTNLPAMQVASGTIDKNGFYYVSSQNSAGTLNYNLYRFNIGAATDAARRVATPLRLRNAGNTANLDITLYDLALNPSDNFLYGVYNNGTLWRIDANGTSTAAPVTVIKNTQTNTDPVGTSFFDVAGNLFVYTNGTVGTTNSGGFYQVNLQTGVYTLISNIDPASVSDGASCINPDQRIDIAKEVTRIQRNGANSYSITFALRIKNTSTATDANVQVNDFLWSGSATDQRANTTFSSVAGQLASNVTIQTAPVITADPNNVNKVFNLAINPNFTGVGGAPGTTNAALLIGNQPLTAGQAATITFTVQVTYGTASPNLTPGGITNTAIASSTTTPNPTGYAQSTTTSGFISAPGQLVATDRSTDGPSLPATANEDTPTPTPVYFTPSILGTVFEDINYGGGLGRTQAASAGVGVAGVRVELYTSGGNFLTFTTTDAAGNYVFSTTNGTNALSANTSYQVRVVNSSVGSSRLGYDATLGLVGIQTYKYGVTTQNQIGGANPNLSDSPANAGTVNGTGGQSLTALQTANPNTIVQSITTVTTPPNSNTVSPALLGVDFGFNFSTVVNTNDSGAGSLRQFILNSNALTNENLTQKSSVPGVTLTPGVEHAIFMMNDGTTTTNGLRAATAIPAATGFNTASGFTITPTSALPSITDEYTAIDGSLQAAVTGNKVAAVTETTTGPEVTINFNNLKGLYVTGGNTTIASIGLNNAKGSIGGTTVTNSDGAGVTLYGLGAAGSTVRDITTSGNARAGVRVESGSTTTSVEDITISNNVLNNNSSTVTTVDADGLELLGTSNATVTGNTISGNKGYGIFLTTAPNTDNTISNNIIRNNGTGTTAADAGISITQGTNNTFSGNTITGNAGDGIVALSGTSSNVFTRNSISNNSGSGIDLSANTSATGDGESPNSTGKLANSGANGLLNFPLLQTASYTNGTTGNLQIRGYAPAGSTVEIFISDVTTAAFGEGQTYIFSASEGGSLASTSNGTTAAITDNDAGTGSYSGTINNLNQGSETGAQKFFFNIPMSTLTLTAAQRTALTNGTSRLTATATLNGATSEFSGNVRISPNTQLPVTLVSFAVQANGQNAKLTWATAQELNNDRFVVERSFNGASFEAIGTVQGQGTTTQAHTYTYTDVQAAIKVQGTAYYRLRQVDTDGTASLSTVQTVRFAAATEVTVFPNPTSASAATYLNLSTLTAGTYQVDVLDLTSRTVRSFSQQGGTTEVINLDGLPQGNYLLTIKGNGQQLTKRLVKE